jgi:hypothetical protein
MSKHPPSGQTPDPLPADDLACDPGIGSSRGAGGRRREDDEAGATTVEGDVANDAALGGGVDPDQRGRTNR